MMRNRIILINMITIEFPSINLTAIETNNGG